VSGNIRFGNICRNCDNLIRTRCYRKSTTRPPGAGQHLTGLSKPMYRTFIRSCKSRVFTYRLCRGISHCREPSWNADGVLWSTYIYL